MESLFDIPPEKRSDNRCRDCKHIANLNPYSKKYWYCTLYRSERTPYGVKAVKRMDKSCNKFEKK